MTTQYAKAIKDCQLVNQWLADMKTITQAVAKAANKALPHLPVTEVMTMAKCDHDANFVELAKKYNRRS